MPPAAWLRICVMALPYAAVGLGLYAFRSAWLTIALYHAGIVLYLVLSRPRFPWRLAIAGVHTRGIMSLSLLSACAGPALIALWPMVARDPSGFPSALTDLGLHGGGWWIFTAYYASLHAVLEEAFWRDPRFRHGRGLAVSDLAFAGYHILVLVQFLHVFWTLVAAVVLLGTAWLWRQAAERYSGLLVPILAHSIAGISTMAVVHVLRGR